MIKRKKKICKTCKKEKYLFSGGNCYDCYKVASQKVSTRKSIGQKKNKIKKTSKKEKERLAKYYVLRESFLKAHPICQVCELAPASEIHHKRGRTGDNLFSDFLATCHPCHQTIEKTPALARQKGHSQSRHMIKVNTFELLMGRTIQKIDKTDDQIVFYTDLGTFKMYHDQDCCEHVRVEDIVGDLNDIIGLPVTLAEETTNNTRTEDADSCTWTFYKIGTVKGTVTIRWLGESNGYYSESVDFVRTDI